MNYPFSPPPRLLMGPGPSNVSPEVLAAQARPTIGHLDPGFVRLMDLIKGQLRAAFRTNNRVTFPLSAPASLAMEMALVTLLEPGDTAIIAQNGVFGGRMAEIARRAGATVQLVCAEWGKPVDPEAVRASMLEAPQAKLLAFVHAETSTGVRSDAAALCALAREAGMLSVVDTVTGLGGIPVLVDDWHADAVYAATQKCLSAPPGLAPITFSDRAVAAVMARTSPIQSWFLDLGLMLGYWEGEGARSYHHTAPVNALYGLHESLSRLLEEGLETSWARHRAAHEQLADRLQGLGVAFVVDKAHRLPQLNTVWVPEGVEDAPARRRLLDEFGIEIGGGLGPLAGRIWRIGLMGETCRMENVERLSDAIAAILP
ncbi:aminotransferase class V-fold PLP-dependent enzyme [Sinorhizobium medicae]|uniref:pyridoxal-phosphate-dependent aminotransferase family protein n=1 Tax=Sinorhizobium medicae TaxID=110321 RepID=UPI000C7D3155|nr:alanine--glyoxylate aminotransferase family protein [Sinorhizobium medicae]MDX0404746.1 aminotransferase class V-fold PLP-dependent enzyme [Sinorhizobium medicae]MDX0416944.1 aminotransferase class V-fold PLP-dependent enzyme [Sinorhizobium medicae]MDX0487358.1 aminotransferase class V-fold PLP-dependent enzyme [Sinorhizobium medicae]MDX0508908.1 aminotransferase class V-fold PLP-dependent enzyme [Sinorhizobium medicae]MDX0554792.1 aminotransferase class V-fold PLP-dependent enzyme [Sinorhi